LNVAVPRDILSGNQSISIEVNGVGSPAGAYIPTVNPLQYQGSTALEVKSRDSRFRLTGRPFWVSSVPRVALVSAAGEVIGVGPGTATIRALNGGYSAKATVVVTQT
jgi:hypothetical protein